MTNQPQREPDAFGSLAAGAKPHDAGAWQPVPPGTLNELRRSLDARHQRQIAIWVSSAAALLQALGLGIWQAVPQAAPQHALNCTQCRELMHAYASHTLAPEQEAQVQAHLDRCKSCLEQYVKVQQELGENPLPASHLASVAWLDQAPAENWVASLPAPLPGSEVFAAALR
mgnify:FL=1